MSRCHLLKVHSCELFFPLFPILHNLSFPQSCFLSPITNYTWILCSLLFFIGHLFHYPLKTKRFICLCVCVVRPGNVRNIIQQFENHTEITGEDGGDAAEAQRLSSSSLGDDSVER